MDRNSYACPFLENKVSLQDKSNDKPDKKITDHIILITPIVKWMQQPMKIEEYSKNKPVLDLFDYFHGTTRGWGIFQDQNGNLKRQFVVDLNGSKNEAGQLVLKEDFVWSDGEISFREWIITRDSKGHYTGKAEDVVGEAKGRSSGNAFNWHYVLNLPVADKIYKVSFDDWMYLQSNTVLLNHAKLSKFGFNLGEVIISFKKLRS